MLFGDEVLSPDRIDELDALTDAEASDRELKMAQQLISSLSADFDPTRFTDDYRERVLDLIERKAAGEEIAVAPEAEESLPAPDLMAALEASLAEVRSGDSDEAPPAKPAPKTPAKSTRKSPAKAAAKTSAKPAAKTTAKTPRKAAAKSK
jgi:DNA end-binding protein Ku